jgi:hypothetical protein
LDIGPHKKIKVIIVLHKERLALIESSSKIALQAAIVHQPAVNDQLRQPLDLVE